MSSIKPTETTTRPATGPFASAGDVLLNILARISELNLPMPALSGRMLVFAKRDHAIQCSGYGVFAVDEDSEDELDEVLSAVDAYAGLHRFTVAWKTEVA